MNLSVIVPFHNSEKTIRECLLSILESDFDKDFEVIAIDDGSSDNSVEGIKDLDIQIIRQENKGAAAARNAGARRSRSDLIVFVDSDVVYLKDTLGRIYGHLKRDDVDYVGGRYSRKPVNQKWVHRYKALADFCYNYDFIFTAAEKKKPIKQVSISCGTEGWKKKVFEKLGRFDENIKGAGVEREKVILRLFRDYKVITDPNIITRHNFPDFGKLVKNYFFRTFHSMDLVFKDNYRPPVFKKNTTRCGLGALTVASLLFSAILSLFFKSALPFAISATLFLTYFMSHQRMFALAFKEYGLLFTVYAIGMNLFFCFLISLAGFLGGIKNLSQR